MNSLLRLISAATLLFWTNSVAAQPVAEAQLRQLQGQDAALATIALRLTTGNAVLCTARMPVTGASLHAANQYPESLAGAVAAVFRFAAPLSVGVVVADSPAAAAGLRENDGVLAVDGLVPPAEDGDGRPDTLVRDAFEAALVARPADQPMLWRIKRDGLVLDLRITPVPGCRARFEVVSGRSLIARNDGQLIKLSAGYVALLHPDELAVIVAHELAHSALLHRQRLVAAGVSKGLLAEFGHNGRLNRTVEREADRLSVYLLRNAGFDPASAERFWRERGPALDGGFLRSRTHDSWRTRAELIAAEIAAMPAGPLPLTPVWLAERDAPLR